MWEKKTHKGTKKPVLQFEFLGRKGGGTCYFYILVFFNLSSRKTFQNQLYNSPELTGDAWSNRLQQQYKAAQQNLIIVPEYHIYTTLRYLAYFLKDILKSGDIVPDANGQHDVPITEDFVVSHHCVFHFKPEIYKYSAFSAIFSANFFHNYVKIA